MPVFVVKCNLMGDEGGQRGPLTPGILHTLFLSTWHAGHVLQIAPGIEEAMVIQTLVLIHRVFCKRLSQLFVLDL
jgi:hypothetical protein